MNDMYSRLPDALSASEGASYITIDGRNRAFADLIKIECQLDKKVLEKKLLGSRVAQHKVVGVSIGGSVSLQLSKGDLLEATEQYIKTGVYPNISLVVINDDPASKYGKREILLTGVIFNTDLLAQLDGESEDIVQYDTEFTADGVEILSNF